MLTNKCYITARYQDHSNHFVRVTLNQSQYLVYIGNFKNIDKIITKLKRSSYFNAICRIRCIYEPAYPEFNSRLDPQIREYLTQQQLPHHAIWLEAIKITPLPEAKLSHIPEQGYFALQDSYRVIHPHLAQSQATVPDLTTSNEKRLVTIHGTLNSSHMLTAYRILAVEGEPLEAPTKLNVAKSENSIPPELRKFFSKQ